MNNMMNEIKRRSASGKNKYSWEDLKKLREQDEARQRDHFKKQFSEHRARETIGRSGILPLHKDCSIDNYIANTAEQNHAKMFAQNYIDSFHMNNGSGFIFSGQPGTGKNHLAAAICNELMDSKHSCMIITVTELMQKLRNCYQSGSENTEDKFIRSMISFDLLILDEIGLQRGSDAEKLALNQIVDQRISRFKPIGMLTNLPAGSNDGSPSMNSVLGIRVMDRMRSGGGKWISFDWESYRK